jgi:hypothetical protein
MKKVLLVAFGASLLGLTACKKDYTCTCTYNGNGMSGSISTTINATKKDAKEACEADNNAYTTCTIN